MSSIIRPATILIKRGHEANLPTLEEGEPAFTTDSFKVFVGSSAGNKEIGGSGGSGGATTLAGLSDTTINSPQNNDFLQYQSSGSWINSPASAGLWALKSGDTFTGNVNINTVLTVAGNINAGANISAGTSLIVNDGGIRANELSGSTLRHSSIFKSSGNASMLFIDAENDHVGIGTFPASPLHVRGDVCVATNGNSRVFEIDHEFGNVALSCRDGAGYDPLDIRGNIITLENQISSYVRASASYVTINENGTSGIDFRAESVGNASMLFVDARNDRVGIGGSAGSTLQITGNVYNTGSANFGDALFFDKSTDRVGIGTGISSPTAYLHVGNTNTTTTPVTGVFVNNIFAPSASAGSVFPIGLNLQAEYNSPTSAGGFQLAQFLDVRNTGNGAISSRNLDIVYRNLGNGTIGRVDNIYIRTPINSGGGSITLNHGIYIENQTGAATDYAIYTNSGQVRFGGGVVVSATSGTTPTGWINVLNGIQRQGAAYTNPDYAVEHYFNNGSIIKFAQNPGASIYGGLLPLENLESYLKENYHLPNRRDTTNLFDWADMAQMWSEEMAIYIIQLHNRLREKEDKIDSLETRLKRIENLIDKI